MSERKQTFLVYLEPEQIKYMEQVKRETTVTVAYQIREAIKAYIKKHQK